MKNKHINAKGQHISRTLTFVSDCEILEAELLVWHRVFDKILLIKRHEVPCVVCQVVHYVPDWYLACFSSCKRLILLP